MAVGTDCTFDPNMDSDSSSSGGRNGAHDSINRRRPSTPNRVNSLISNACAASLISIHESCHLFYVSSFLLLPTFSLIILSSVLRMPSLVVLYLVITHNVMPPPDSMLAAFVVVPLRVPSSYCPLVVS